MGETGLSARLAAILELVPQAESLADIGTDHAYLPLAALAAGRVARAYGIDRAAAPLALAEAHRRASGLGERLQLRQGDGLLALAEPVEVVTLAGLGGRAIARMLEQAPAALASTRRIIAQPNQEPECVRAWAARAGWHLVAEAMVAERDRFFPVLAFERGQGPDPAYAVPGFTREALERLGPRLLAACDPLALQWYRRQHDRLSRLQQDAEPWAQALRHCASHPSPW